MPAPSTVVRMLSCRDCGSGVRRPLSRSSTHQSGILPKVPLSQATDLCKFGLVVLRCLAQARWHPLPGTLAGSTGYSTTRLLPCCTPGSGYAGAGSTVRTGLGTLLVFAATVRRLPGTRGHSGRDNTCSHQTWWGSMVAVDGFHPRPRTRWWRAATGTSCRAEKDCPPGEPCCPEPRCAECPGPARRSCCHCLSYCSYATW